MPGSENPTPLSPYGRALRDYHAGAVDAELTLHSDLGEHDSMPVGVFFRGEDELFPFERMALELCRGTVLDFGAGTGVHSLALQDREIAVRAIEVVPQAVEIMRERGVRDVVHGDGFAYDGSKVDTVLMMMNGIGPTGTLAGLDRFLARAPALLTPGGQILVDSGAAQRRAKPEHAPEMSWPSPPGDYVGEAWIRLEYRGEVGAPFRELYVDFETLRQRAAGAGWRTIAAYQGDEGSYLARLSR